MDTTVTGPGRPHRPGISHRYLYLALIGIFPFLVNGPINARIAATPWLYWSFELTIWIAVPGAILVILLRDPGFRLADIGLHTRVFGRRGPGVVAVACLLFAPLCFMAYRSAFSLFDSWFPEGGFFHYDTVIPDSGPARYAVITYFAMSAGLVEEFLCRGLLYRAAQEFRWPRLFFMLVSPLLFSLVHWESGLANLLATWVYGLCMAGALLWLRNLWPLIAGHVATDLLWFS